LSVHESAESADTVDTYRSTTIPGSEPFTAPKPAHAHAWTVLSLTHTATGTAKLTLVCVCGAFKHVDAFDVDAKSPES